MERLFPDLGPGHPLAPSSQEGRRDPGVQLRQLLGCCLQERPGWAVGMAPFPHRPVQPYFHLCPACPLVSTRAPWAWVFCDYHPKPTQHGILEEDETSPFAFGLVCFSMGPGPVVLWAAGLALAPLRAAGLCPCQQRASKPGAGRSGMLASQKNPSPVSCQSLPSPGSILAWQAVSLDTRIPSHSCMAPLPGHSWGVGQVRDVDNAETMSGGPYSSISPPASP